MRSSKLRAGVQAYADEDWRQHACQFNRGMLNLLGSTFNSELVMENAGLLSIKRCAPVKHTRQRIIVLVVF